MSLTEQLSKQITDNERKCLTDIFNFTKPYFPESSIEELQNVIWMHWFYGTIDCIYRGEKIVSGVRWNISPDGRICHVLDLFINKGENGFRIMKHFIARNWHRFPTVKYIMFARSRKYAGRKERLYAIQDILHLKGGK